MEKKNLGGRPLKFPDAGSMQIKIDAYFGECDPHLAKRQIVRLKADGSTYIGEEEYITDQKPYTITGLALALDTNRQTLINYQSGIYNDPGKSEDENQKFIDTVIRAKIRCEQYAEQHLFTGKNAAGAMFNLKNNHSWEDRTVVDQNNHDIQGDLDGLDKGVEEAAAKAEEALNAAQGPEAQ